MPYYVSPSINAPNYTTLLFAPIDNERLRNPIAQSLFGQKALQLLQEI